MVVQLCEDTKIQWTVYFKWVNYMACELILKKLFLKKSLSSPKTACVIWSIYQSWL